LTLAEARNRAAAISGVSYDVDLDLRDVAGDRSWSRTVVRFTSAAPETFLELAQAKGLGVEVDGRPVDAAYDGVRIRPPCAECASSRGSLHPGWTPRGFIK
jgi:aminopeptidase N